MYLVIICTTDDTFCESLFDFQQNIAWYLYQFSFDLLIENVVCGKFLGGTLMVNLSQAKRVETLKYNLQMSFNIFTVVSRKLKVICIILQHNGNDWEHIKHQT